MFPTEKYSGNKEKGSGSKVKGRGRVTMGSGSELKGSVELKYDDCNRVAKGIYPIFKVPKTLRDLQRETYDPKRVGLGIYHHEMHPNSSEMVENKVRALCTTTKRIKGITVANLVAEIQALDLDIRKCYRDSTGNFSEEILAWNFAMDACFILEFFRSSYWFTDHTIEREIMSDIFKLENQIPLFILLRILELEFQTREKAICKLADILCMHPHISILPFSLKPMELRILKAELEANIKEGACHLLHLLSKAIEAFLRPSNIPTGDCIGMDTNLDTVNDQTDFMSAIVDGDAHILQELVIKFKPTRDGQVRFEKGWFGQAVLYLPQIYLFDETEPLLWNLIAFAVGLENNIIGHFMFFVKCVVSSNSTSIAVLREEKIIISNKSNEELSTMLNKVSNKITESCGPFENVWSQVKKHCSNPSNKWVDHSTIWFSCLLFLFTIIGFVIKW